jgi:tripartite-type tricarboxylate transporter receptor subunit TctC
MTTTLSRRGVMLGASALLTAQPARAQATYPDKPIRVIVPFGPGGLADVTIRVVGEKLSAVLGQQIIVVNMPGANGVTAVKAVQAAPGDGYTLALFTNGTAITHALAKTPAFDPMRDFKPISSLGYFDFVFVTGAASPFVTLSDFIASARPEPRNIGTITVGSSQNLSAVLFKSLTGSTAVIVPFRTTPDVMTATLRGDVHLAIDGYSAAKSLLADKQLRALAVSGPKRNPALPDVPTAAEAGITGFEVTSWNALFALSAVPSAIVDTLNAKLAEVLADAGVRAKLADLGIEARGSTAAGIGERLRSDIAKWGDVIAKAGIEKT